MTEPRVEQFAGGVTLYSGDCLAVLPTLAENSVDSCVCDPPYHLTSIVKRFGDADRQDDTKTSDRSRRDADFYARLSTGFMGKQWDGGDIAFRPEVWREVWRVLKPGAHLLAFGGTRTYHRMACAIEDAGFEIRDTIMWVYGSGFPKSHDVSKGIDRRKDWNALPKLQSAIRAARNSLGISQSEAARQMGLIGPAEDLGGGGFMWFETGLRLPTRKQWPRLKQSLGIGDDFDKCFEEAEREITGEVAEWKDRSNYAITSKDGFRRDNPATASARQWEGWGTALKPAVESIILAQKPSIFGHDYHLIGSHLIRLEARLWSMLPAKTAENYFGLSQSEYDAVSASAQWSVGEKSNTQVALREAMGMSRYVSAIVSSLNTVFSWSATWAEGSKPENTSITETALKTIIDLRTLKFLLSKITPSTIMQAHGLGLWSISHAPDAERIFDATARSLQGILEQHALAPAIAEYANRSQGVDDRIAVEPIVLARKPLSEGTVAANVLKWGTGAINIDGCRVPGQFESGWSKSGSNESENIAMSGKNYDRDPKPDNAKGRWPANLIHDGSEEVVAGFPESDDSHVSGSTINARASIGYGGSNTEFRTVRHAGDGSAARFFYTAKADSDDRLGSKHPTVKPLDLMQYLVRLMTPKGGVVLDPFAGTGTTGEAAFREGMRAVLIERETEYQTDIRRRMALMLSGPDERAREAIKARMKDKPMDAGPLFGWSNA